MSKANGKPCRILVTDAGLGSAIAIIRSLGRSGYRVLAGDSDRRSLGFRSRHAHQRVLYPSPLDEPDRFAAAVQQTVAEHRVDLVIPVTDAAILPLLKIRSKLPPPCRLAVPDAQALETTTNKAQTVALARRFGVPVPETFVIDTAEQALQHAGSLRWPVVLKPQVSRVYREGEPIDALTVTYANDPDGLQSAMRRLEGRCPVLLQEYTPGVGHGVELLLSEGRPLAAFQHERIREIPISGGASAFRKSVPLDPVLYDYSVRLLSQLAWTGLAMVEFKMTNEGPKLMEINGRVWGSLPLAVHSGMDFPKRLADLYLSGSPDPGRLPETKYKIGVHSRNLEYDVMWILSVLLKPPRHPFLAPPKRRAGALALLGLFNPASRFDILSLHDPVPGLAEIPKIMRKLRHKLKQG